MELFGNSPDQNLLPCDGTVNYFGPVLGPSEAAQCFQSLLRQIAWRNDEVFLFGKHIITARKVAWYADAPLSYTYSGTTKQALGWTPELIALKGLVEDLTQTSYNACLLNLYHDGNEGMSWHSDDEKSVAPNSSIASISLGAEREFRFKHKSRPLRISIPLESGSLLVMKDATQSHWLHALPKSKKVNEPRINLTFRLMVATFPRSTR